MSSVLNSLAEVLSLGWGFFHCLEIQKSRTSLVTDKEGVLRKSGIIPNVERTLKYL